MSILDDIVLYNQNLLKVELKCSHQREKEEQEEEKEDEEEEKKERKRNKGERERMKQENIDEKSRLEGNNVFQVITGFMLQNVTEGNQTKTAK